MKLPFVAEQKLRTPSSLSLRSKISKKSKENYSQKHSVSERLGKLPKKLVSVFPRENHK